MVKEKPNINTDELEELVEKNPKSKKWNNPNSRKNLRQYRDKGEPEEGELIEPEVIDPDEEEAEADHQAEEITRGIKLSPKIVKSLIPKRGVLTPREKERFNRLVVTILADFKNEEPTASDVADILEVAICDTMEQRLMEASRGDPGVIVATSQAMERWYKRKQQARENLATRRVDRNKDARNSQDISIVDLAVRYDAEQRKKDKDRLDSLLKEESNVAKQLKDMVEEEVF